MLKSSSAWRSTSSRSTSSRIMWSSRSLSFGSSRRMRWRGILPTPVSSTSFFLNFLKLVPPRRRRCGCDSSRSSGMLAAKTSALSSVKTSKTSSGSSGFAKRCFGPEARTSRLSHPVSRRTAFGCALGSISAAVFFGPSDSADDAAIAGASASSATSSPSSCVLRFSLFIQPEAAAGAGAGRCRFFGGSAAPPLSVVSSS
mmetsp:Transcript_9967/g.29323  ORF Transcript_9967/g.29323 Transcript_9967/m.29323 type:complete len:200 (-) Transcript_9967:223-822(-)